MTVSAFEGPAGTGKTYSLIGDLTIALANQPLEPHSRVLALTFMHGARRRLDSRLRAVPGLVGRFQATTLDSFVWRLTQRWRRLADTLGYGAPAEGEYDATCRLATQLMRHCIVKRWIAISFPLVLVDEAQDLSSERSQIIAAMAEQSHVLLAFDEFQCLDPDLLPIAIMEWVPRVCVPNRLTTFRRTYEPELLEAARALRNGERIRRSGRRFNVAVTPGSPRYGGTYLANFIAWRGGGTVAVLTPSRRGGFADSIVEVVRTESLGRQNSGPYPVEWESSDDTEHKSLSDQIDLPEHCSVAEALERLAQNYEHPIVRATHQWVARQRRVLGQEEITAEEINQQLLRLLTARRHYMGRQLTELAAMSIHQAKNREFDHVVVIWPYTAPTDAEQKRRLLYNAITRAKQSCLVLVQAQSLVDAPPFTA